MKMHIFITKDSFAAYPVVKIISCTLQVKDKTIVDGIKPVS